MIGAFCRLYTIQSAIETFLPDVYAPCDGKSDRYSYLAGTTSGGLVIYDDGLFAYSNHSTDPARGLDLNAFDLVRIHKFGDKDDRSKEDTPITKLPSYKAMIDFAVNLGDVKVEILKEKNQSALDDFEGEDEEKDWRKTLDTLIFTVTKGCVIDLSGTGQIEVSCDTEGPRERIQKGTPRSNRQCAYRKDAV